MFSRANLIYKIDYHGQTLIGCITKYEGTNITLNTTKGFSVVVKPEQLHRYTGLKDNRYDGIFEDDKVMLDGNIPCVVVWEGGAFCLKSGDVNIGNLSGYIKKILLLREPPQEKDIAKEETDNVSYLVDMPRSVLLSSREKPFFHTKERPDASTQFPFSCYVICRDAGKYDNVFLTSPEVREKYGTFETWGNVDEKGYNTVNYGTPYEYFSYPIKDKIFGKLICEGVLQTEEGYLWTGEFHWFDRPLSPSEVGLSDDLLQANHQVIRLR